MLLRFSEQTPIPIIKKNTPINKNSKANFLFLNIVIRAANKLKTPKNSPINNPNASNLPPNNFVEMIKKMEEITILYQTIILIFTFIDFLTSCFP